MSIKINAENYLVYRKVYEVLWSYKEKLIKKELSLMQSDFVFDSPIKVLDEIEKKSLSIARKSLLIGLQDIFSQHQYFGQAFLVDIDQDLISRGLPSLFAINAQLKNGLQNVLKKKKINTLSQYYYIIEILNDTEAQITGQDREILNSAVANFEFKQNATAQS